MRKPKCTHEKETYLGELLCSQGCDYQRARELSAEHAYQKTGCRLHEPFFAYRGLKLIADGGEACGVRIECNKPLYLEAEGLRILIDALHQGMRWCEDGDAPGIC